MQINKNDYNSYSCGEYSFSAHRVSQGFIEVSHKSRYKENIPVVLSGNKKTKELEIIKAIESYLAP